MSLEHIFRNLNDIRVFDVISEFTEKDAVFMDTIMDLLELPDRERIQIEDSVKHLVEQEIIGITYSPEEYSTGCDTCKHTDDNKQPRYIGHESHKPMEHGISQIEKYYLMDNKLTKLLVSAVMESSFIYAEKEMKKRKIDHKCLSDKK